MKDTETNMLREARAVLMQESAALAKLSEELPADFTRLCSRILNCNGRVILAGVGKSGILHARFLQLWQAQGRRLIISTPQRPAMGIWV